MSAAVGDHELASRARSLPGGKKTQLAALLIAGELNLASTSDVRTALGIATPEAAGLSSEFRQLADRFGADVARGLVLGVCSTAAGDASPQLVWTAPGAPAAARRTAQVAADLVRNAREKLVVVGYSLTQAARPFVQALAVAARRGVTCSLVADRMDEKLPTLVALWPSDLELPTLWTRPADPEDEQSALHAKFIVADARHLLVTSANLTYHGFHGNIEMGVLLDGSVAAQAEQLVREWSKAGLIRLVGATP